MKGSKLSKRVHCKFCDWSTPTFKRLKDGTTRGPEAAFERLRDHVWINHEDEWSQVVEFIKEEEHTPTRKHVRVEEKGLWPI